MSNGVLILVNNTILLVSLIETLFLITKVNFEDYFYIYWVTQMMLRQYPGIIHGDLISIGYDSKELLDLL